MQKIDSLEDAVLVTHRGCLDGAGAAILFINGGGKSENIRYVSPRGFKYTFFKNDPVMKSDKFLIIVDVSFSDLKIASELEKRGNCIVLDHHKTSSPLKEFSWCEIDYDGGNGSCCGCEMFRRYLKRNEVGGVDWDSFEWFTRIIDDHDRWIMKERESERLALIMTFLGQKRFVDDFVDLEWRKDQYNWSKTLTTEFEDEIISILAEKRNDAAKRETKFSVKKTIHYAKKNGKRVGAVAKIIVSSDENTSFVLNEILDSDDLIDVAIQVNVDKGSVSLRSDGRCDTSEIAEYYGGGGHENASAHPVKENLFEELVELLYDCGE